MRRSRSSAETLQTSQYPDGAAAPAVVRRLFEKRYMARSLGAAADDLLRAAKHSRRRAPRLCESTRQDIDSAMTPAHLMGARPHYPRSRWRAESSP